MRRAVPILFLLLAVVALCAGAWWYWPGRERFERVSFADLPGWRQSDPAAALAAFRRSCNGIVSAQWRPACRASATARDARAFFETNFVPYGIGDGLVTGYYEPLLNGSTARHGAYQVPVYGLPDDLVTVDLGQFRPEWKGVRVTGAIDGHRVVPYPSRAMLDAAPPKARVLFYGDDPIAVFFLHIQGSGRVWLDDGRMLRVTYAGQNGQPYTAVGRTLIAEGALTRENVSMSSIRAWLLAHPERARAVMETDASFVFFREEPIADRALGPGGTQGVALTPRASIAVDPRAHPFGTPMFIAGDGIDGLYIAQDTGGAIKGAARADIFFGFGPGADAAAGNLKAHADFYVLLPK
jgi:membrane-bound lytic murein transglycosylase A